MRAWQPQSSSEYIAELVVEIALVVGLAVAVFAAGRVTARCPCDPKPALALAARNQKLAEGALDISAVCTAMLLQRRTEGER